MISHVYFLKYILQECCSVLAFLDEPSCAYHLIFSCIKKLERVNIIQETDQHWEMVYPSYQKNAVCQSTVL